MTNLYLIRHGETTWNADGRFQGHQDTSLSDLGRAQAHQAAKALANRHFDAIYTSDLSRAAETASIIAAPHGLTPLPDTRLREAFFGEWEGLSMPEITARWPDLVTAWRTDSRRTRPPGGETLEHVLTRVAAFTEEVIQRFPDGVICVVGHGGSVRAIIANTLAADPSIYRRLRVDNCAISVVNVKDGRYRLEQMNDTCHLTRKGAVGDETGDQWRLALSPQPTDR